MSWHMDKILLTVIHCYTSEPYSWRFKVSSQGSPFIREDIHLSPIPGNPASSFSKPSPLLSPATNGPASDCALPRPCRPHTTLRSQPQAFSLHAVPSLLSWAATLVGIEFPFSPGWGVDSSGEERERKERGEKRRKEKRYPLSSLFSLFFAP